MIEEPWFLLHPKTGHPTLVLSRLETRLKDGKLLLQSNFALSGKPPRALLAALGILSGTHAVDHLRKIRELASGAEIIHKFAVTQVTSKRLGITSAKDKIEPFYVISLSTYFSHPNLVAEEVEEQAREMHGIIAASTASLVEKSGPKPEVQLRPEKGWKDNPDWKDKKKGA